MRFKVLALLLGLAALGSAQAPKPNWISYPEEQGKVIDWGDGKDHMLVFTGTRKPDKQGKAQHELNIRNLGIDHWEDGKLVDDLWERWELKLADPSFSPAITGKGPHGTLERMIFSRAWSQGNTAAVEIRNYSTTDGDFKILRLDWEKCELDFQLIGSTVDPPIECEVRWEVEKSANPVLAFAYLKSLRGLVTIRTLIKKQLVSIEYRPTEYNHVLNLPMEMKGMKTAGQKRWNELIRTLSPEDQIAWYQLRAHKNDWHDITENEVIAAVRRKHPEITEAVLRSEKEPTKELNDMVLDASFELAQANTLDFFSHSNLSASGQKALTDFLMKDLRKAFRSGK